MSLRRNKIQIIHDILKSIIDKNGKIKPTHLLYKSNLSHQKMTEYIQELIQKEMLSEVEEKSGKFYMITDKGRTFFHEYRKIREFISSFGLEE
ncbi:MAG: winged helix-turn-helix domain-containing protein [Nanoarchaeota archaeon]